MHNSIGVLAEDARCRCDRRAGTSIVRGWTLAAFVLSGVFISQLGGMAAAHAGTMLQGPDAAYAELRGFVRAINAERGQPIVAKDSGAVGGGPDDEIYSALREFTRTIDPDEPDLAPAAGLQLAEATNGFDALREFLQGSHPEQAPPAARAPSKATKAAPRPIGAADATYVSSKVCTTCHADHVAAFGETLMGKLFKQGKIQCETCHGPGSAHVKAGGGRGVGIVSFRIDDTAREPRDNNAICLGCHERGDRTYWSGSTHETQDLACTNCHTIMKRVSVKFSLKTAVEPETCFQCHKDRRAQMFRSSHMPLREGKMVCSDCHNPHGSATQALLKTDSINDTCYKCHAEKRGPFLFEHLPVRENCVNCHNPHGSVNEFMLKVSRPRLCAECHSIGHGQATGMFAVQAMSRSCQNCHTEIHGTNSPSGALLHR